LREGEVAEVDITPEPRMDGRDGYQIGIVMGAVSGTMPWSRYRTPGAQLKGDVSGIARILQALFIPQQKSESARAGGGLGGPVGILAMLWQIIMVFGIVEILAFLRFLSVNLAILNLLPLPVLDGGHIVFALWRGVFGREIHPKIVNALVLVFAFLLIGVFLLITGRDIMRIFGL